MHLNTTDDNIFEQILIFFFSSSGKKLSKRNDAVFVEHYKVRRHCRELTTHFFMSTLIQG